MTAKKVWEKWKQLAYKIGNFQSRLLLTIFYFTVAAPFGLGVRFFSDPLRMKKCEPGWLERQPPTADLNWARRQF